MNNRGQFFVIFAVLIGLLVLGITTMYNSFSKTEFNPENFYDICHNYDYEIHKISELNSTGDIRDEETAIKLFTLNFTKYHRDKDYNLSLIYIYSDSGSVKALNNFQRTINITGEILNDNNLNQDLPSSSPFSITVNNIPIKTGIYLNSHDFYYLMQLKKGDETFNCESNENE